MDDQNREYEDYEALHDELFALLDQHRMKALSQKLGEMNEFDISEFLGELWEDNPQRMAMVFRILSKEIAAAVFANLEVEEQETIINSITDTELAGIIEELYVDDAVDMMEELPANVVKRVMRTATPATRNLINQYLKYPENSAGSIMTAEFVDLKKYMSVREAFARIRKIGEDKETIYVCYVTSAKRKLEGVVTVKDLLLSDDDVILEDIMDTNVIYASTTDDQEEVSEMISNYDLIAIPVVDKEGCLVGIVTVDDIIDVMEQETTEDIEKMAGITPSDKPYSRTSVVDIWKNRIPWLMFLMLSATFTGMIVTHFEDALATQVALASFMPMLMGTVVYGGSLEFVLASLLLSAFSPLSAFLMALMIQARHLFYGLAMLERYKGYGLRSFYMIFAMSDETFSITCSAEPPEGVDKGWFMFFITLLDQFYWVFSAGLGAVVGSVLPFSTEGVDFVMTAMFTVIFLNQWEKDRQHYSALIGLAAPLACLVFFGSGSFLLPSMGCILILLLALRKPIEKAEGTEAEKSGEEVGA